MPFPNPRVLIKFMSHYLTVRQETWDTTRGKIQAAIYRDDGEIKTQVCRQVKTKISNKELPDSFAHIAEFLYYLGKLGREAGLLAFMMNAIRTYTIASIKSSPAFVKDRNSLIEELRTTTKSLNEKIKISMQAKEPEDEMKQLINNRDIVLLRRCDIGDQDAIFEAEFLNLHLFKNLEFPKSSYEIYGDIELNQYVPLSYHPEAYLIYYEMHMRPYLLKSFADFEKDSAAASIDEELFMKKKNIYSESNARSEGWRVPSIVSSLTNSVTSFWGNSQQPDKNTEAFIPVSTPPSNVPSFANSTDNTANSENEKNKGVDNSLSHQSSSNSSEESQPDRPNLLPESPRYIQSP